MELCALVVFVHQWTFPNTWTTSFTDLSWSLPPPGSISCSPKIRLSALPTSKLTPLNLVSPIAFSVCSWLFLPGRGSLKVKGRVIFDFSQVFNIFQPNSQVFSKLTSPPKLYIYGWLIINKDSKTIPWGITIISTNDSGKTKHSRKWAPTSYHIQK